MDIVNKLWGFCHKLRHDGIDSSDYIEQLTYLLFLKMADEKKIAVPEGYDWQSLLSKNVEELPTHLDRTFKIFGFERKPISQIFLEPISRINDGAVLKQIIVEISEFTWSDLDLDEVVNSFEELAGRRLIRFAKNYKTIQHMPLPKEKTISFRECVLPYQGKLPKKIQKENILELGKYPIISQSHKEIIGYTNEANLLFSNPLPVIVFGDHTRVFKYVDYPFAIYGDGVKIIIPKTEILIPKYLFYALKATYITDLGYNRHFSEVKKMNILVPSLMEQKEIVKELDEKFAFFETEEKRIEKQKKEIQNGRVALFNQFFNSTRLQL